MSHPEAVDPDQPVLSVTCGAAPERLDRLLAGAADGLSRTRIKALIEAGLANVDGHVVSDPSAMVRPGQTAYVGVPAPAPAEPQAEAIELSILHEDADLIVIDKPAGLVVHPAAGHETGTLVNALIAHCGASLSGIGGVRRPGIVHRLDKDTSGVMVVAKNDHAHQHLSAQFADHGRTGPLERAYTAIAWGTFDRPRGTIRTGIDRSTKNREKMAVVPEGRGRLAITHYTVEETFGREMVASLVTCRLQTGRTHQIRVHLAHAGHPILGDDVYGSGYRTKASRLPEAATQALAALGRQALHARLLGFEHPTSGAHLVFESALPTDLATLVSALKQS